MRIKNKLNIKLLFSLFLTLTVIWLMFYATHYIFSTQKDSPEIKNGQLDLAGWDFTRDGFVMLNGEWGFYNERLLDPQDVAHTQPALLKVPGTWGLQKPQGQSARGSATYHITVRLPEMKEKLALKVQNIWMAHRLFINGKLVKEMGMPAKQGYKPQNTPYLIEIDPMNKLDIVIQVSNYIYLDGGIIHPIQLGERTEMELRSQLALGMDVAAFFLFLLIGIFHLNMYQMQNRESTYLYSGLYLIITSFLFLTSGEKLLMRLFDALPFTTLYKVQDLLNFLSFLSLLFFIRSLESRVMTRRTAGLVMLPILLFLLYMIAVPYGTYIQWKNIAIMYIVAILVFCVLRLFYLLLQKKDRELPLNEFIYVVCSIAFVFLMLFHSVLYYSGYLNSNFGSKISMLGFLIVLNILLARRFTNKMNEIQTLSDQLSRSNAIKDEFLTRTSHELMTPLHGMMNISHDLLRERSHSLSQEQRDHIALIQDTASKLSILVNDLIDATKLHHRDLKLTLMSVDVYVVVQVVFQLLSINLEHKGLRLINGIQPLTLVEADENRLRQILYNLINHAVKYTQQGDIIVWGCEEDAGIVLHISDPGLTIPLEQWELLFQDGYRGEAASATLEQGVDLGLYISRQLARMMNGEVWVSDSTAEKGTILSVRLPQGMHAFPPSLTELPESNREPKQPKPEHSTTSVGKKILLVDDEPTNIRVLSMMLEDQFELITACRADEALHIIQNHSLDLVITDMMMPGMSGIELVQRIRETFSVIRLPIIVATVGNSIADIELAYRAGANDYITKPFTAEEIKSRVKILLQLADVMETALQNEVAFLQAQIKPHFLYNALSNIIALCYEDGRKAAELLSVLSRYLRYIFQTDQNQPFIPLSQELNMIQAYVEIESLRFGERLHYEFDVAPGIVQMGFMVPALLIQPLIENAIRHGLFNKQGSGCVKLEITEKDDYIRIVVADDGIGMSEEQLSQINHQHDAKGVGLQNVEKRIASLPHAAFTIESELGTGTICTVELPKDLLKRSLKVVR
jgi:signal transduction histidine kinase